MGGFLSGVLGTNSSVQTSNTSPYQALQPWQQTAQGLNAQLQTEAAGGGPNPSQQRFLQNSQQVAQQQAANYAQNRALNPGLAARMAGNTAANLQQNAASTAGIQQAQQQLAAQQLQGNVLSQQQTALNQAGAVNAGIAAGNQQQAGQITGGLLGGIGSALGLAHGGMVPKYDGGGTVMPSSSDWSQWAQNSSGVPSAQDWALTMGAPQSTPIQTTSTGGASSSIGKILNGLSDNMSGSGPNSVSAFNQFSRYMSSGGRVPEPKPEPKINQVPKSDRFNMNENKVSALVSPGEKYLKPDQAKKVAEGRADPMKTGEKIKGKAKVKGDSEANDTVPKTLEEGGIVIPRSEMGSEEDAQKFVAQEMAKHMKSPEGEFREALKRAVAGRKNR
jgi:hypothetical protein